MAVPPKHIAGEHVTRDHLLRKSSLVGGPTGLFPLLELLTTDMEVYKDDFEGTTLKTFWGVGNGGGGSAASPVIPSDATSSIARFTTGTAGDNTAMSELSLGRYFTAEKSCGMVCRILSDVVTGFKIEVGFHDTLQGTDAGAVNVLATPSAVGGNADFVGWVVDSADSGNDTQWQAVGFEAGTAATKIEPSLTVTAATYDTLMIELREEDSSGNSGAARFRRFDSNGRQTYDSVLAGDGWMTSCITSTTALTPHIYVEARNATSKVVDVDFLWVWGRRTES